MPTKDELERQSRSHLARYTSREHLSEDTERRCALPKRPPTHCRSKAIAGCYDEVGRTDDTPSSWTTWMEDTTMSEDKQCLQRDITEVYVSRRGAGRTCLMFVVKSRRMMSTLPWSKPRNECQYGLHVVTRQPLPHGVCYAEVLFQPSFYYGRAHVACRTRDSKRVDCGMVWNAARHGSRKVTLPRLRLSAFSRDLSQRIPG